MKLPISLEAYRVAHLYVTNEMSKECTKSGQGVEILENTPCDSSCLPNKHKQANVSHVQRTSKRYYIPDSITASVGVSDCVLSERSFKGFPNMRTTINGENGEITIDTICKKYQKQYDENVFKLPQAILDKRSVIDIDVVNDELPQEFRKEHEDPKHVLGLTNTWQSSLNPLKTMDVYKLVFVKSSDLTNKEKINALAMDTLQTVITAFHKKLICSQDQWIGLNIRDIRTLEDETTDVLDIRRK